MNSSNSVDGSDSISTWHGRARVDDDESPNCKFRRHSDDFQGLAKANSDIQACIETYSVSVVREGRSGMKRLDGAMLCVDARACVHMAKEDLTRGSLL